jgi:hypothetical protein
MLLLLGNRDTFYEHRPGGIYTIGEIVSHMVLTIINSEGHFSSASSYEIVSHMVLMIINSEGQWRLIAHIDVVVRTADSKKACQI